jgi:hypothetical protein
MYTFVVGCCGPLLSLPNESSISDVAGNTTGIDILESRVGWSVLVREYVGYPQNDAIIVVILLLGI